MHDTLASRGHVQYDPYTSEQQYEIQLLAESFLKGQRDEVEEITSMRQVKELLAQMRNCFLKLRQDGKNILEAETLLAGDGTADSEKNGLKRGNTHAADGVGEIQDQGEFGLGIAPRDSKPVNKIELSKAQEAEIAEANAFSEYAQSEASAPLDDDGALLEAARNKNKAKLRPAIGKQAAFMEFKVEPEGKSLEESIRDDRTELKALKVTVRTLTEQCNAAKRDIDIVKRDLDKKQEERRQTMHNHMAAVDDDELMDNEDGPQEIIDEEELLLLQRMKELKKAYRAAYSNLRTTKGQVSQIQSSVDQAKQQLVAQFEYWYDDTFESGPAGNIV
jgi:kinesin family protein 6/9